MDGRLKALFGKGAFGSAPYRSPVECLLSSQTERPFLTAWWSEAGFIVVLATDFAWPTSNLEPRDVPIALVGSLLLLVGSTNGSDRRRRVPEGAGVVR